MKKSIWFYLSILLVVLVALFFLTSCQKSNAVVLHHWKIQYWKDTVAVQNAMCECPGDATWFSDTVASYNNYKPGLASNDLASHPDQFKFQEWNGLWIRTYFMYKEQID